MRYLLDSSALFAWYFGEPGGEQVAALFDDESEILVSVLTAGELASRLAVGRVRVDVEQPDVEQLWSEIVALVSTVVPVSIETVFEAARTRSGASSRLPYVDALIAATAKLAGATLVHRDPHFRSIATGGLAQLVLEAR